MKLYNFLFFLPIISISNCLNIKIPVKSNSLQDFYNCINNVNFFKLNMKYLDCENTVINQDLDKPIVKWPVQMFYDRKHKLKKYPSLPIPKLRTEEFWNININTKEITGTITTKLVIITLKIKINENNNKKHILQRKRNTLLMETKVNHKSFIVPISNNELEADISEQIVDNIKLVFKDMTEMGICDIELIDNP